MHISVFEFSPNHAHGTKEGCSGLITWGTIVKSGAGGCCMVKNSQIQDFLVDSVWTLCPCGTISRDNPIFYAPNWSPLHKESIHRSHVHQGCMPVIISSGFASVATFRGLSPRDYFVLLGPWVHLPVYISGWMIPNHAQRTKEGCSCISTRGFSVKSGPGGCFVL